MARPAARDREQLPGDAPCKAGTVPASRSRGQTPITGGQTFVPARGTLSRSWGTLVGGGRTWVGPRGTFVTARGTFSRSWGTFVRARGTFCRSRGTLVRRRLRSAAVSNGVSDCLETGRRLVGGLGAFQNLTAPLPHQPGGAAGVRLLWEARAGIPSQLEAGGNTSPFIRSERSPREEPSSMRVS